MCINLEVADIVKIKFVFSPFVPMRFSYKVFQFSGYSEVSICSLLNGIKFYREACSGTQMNAVDSDPASG
jgi:hypothetical protein